MRIASAWGVNKRNQAANEGNGRLSTTSDRVSASFTGQMPFIVVTRTVSPERQGPMSQAEHLATLTYLCPSAIRPLGTLQLL